jgi:hypothetical protein
MADFGSMPLRVVDAMTLDAEYREVLQPGTLRSTRDGHGFALPRYFLEVPSWEAALETQLSDHFCVWEFLNVDVRETKLLRASWPRYLPCSITLLAAHLEVLRREVDTYIHVAANGGYRSPAHALSTHASTHCWGTAVNLYRVGDDWLDDEPTIARYRELIGRLLPGVWMRPFGDAEGEAGDHLHLDLGHVTLTPRREQLSQPAGEPPTPDDREIHPDDETEADEQDGAGPAPHDDENENEV